MNSSHPFVNCTNTTVSSTSLHKHLRIILDYKFSYEHHLKFVLNKVKKTVSLLHKNLESIQYNAAIATTGTIRRTSSVNSFKN